MKQTGHAAIRSARVKLTPMQKRVLWGAQHRADATVAELKELSGCREHTIRSCLRRLYELGIIHPMYAINLAPLGISSYDLFFSLAIKNSGKRRKLLQAVEQSDRVSLLVELGGDFEYSVALSVHGVEEVWDFIEHLGAKFGELFFEKAVVVRHSYTGFGRKYLTGSQLRHHIVLGPAERQVQIDHLDHKILRALSRAQTVYHLHIARELGIAPATLHYRMKRLRAAGVLVGEIYAVTPRLFGMHTFRMLIFAKAVTRTFHQAFFSYCARHPNIVNLIQAVGAWDYEIGVDVERAEDAPAISAEIQGRFEGKINTVKILPVFRYLKGSGYPFERLPEGARSPNTR